MVESFELDHTKVIAPYVRRACVTFGDNGDVVSKYDLRFLQPNKAELHTGVIHAIEHILSVELRKRIKRVIDVSPMGCRTGFYLIVWGEHENEEIMQSLKESLKSLLEYKAVHAANEIQCGNFKDIDLEGAKKMCLSVLSKGFHIMY